MTDPIWPDYRRYYHLALLLVWLIRYVEYLFTATLANTTCAGAEGANSTNAGSTGSGALGATLVDDVLLGVFVVLFILAYIYRSAKTWLRHEKVVYATLFVELLLETALVLYYVIHLFVYKSSRTHFALVMWHVIWIIHLSLIIYKLLVLLVWFLYLKYWGIQQNLADLTSKITGSTKRKPADVGPSA